MEPVEALFYHIANQTTYNYSQVYIYTHQKGRRDVLVFNSKNLTHERCSLKLFNNFFNTINKRILSQADNKLFNIDLFSKGISLVFHNESLRTVLYLTNDFFLPISEEELDLTSKELNATSNKTLFLLYRTLEDIDNNFFKKYINNSLLDPKDQVSQRNKDFSGFQNEKSINLNKEIHISEVYQNYKYEILGQLLNTLKHELSNPLFGINALSQILFFDDYEINNFVKQINLKSSQAIDIINNCNNYYNDDKRDSFNLFQIIDQTLLFLKSILRDIKLTKNIDISNSFLLNKNKVSFTQVITNILINATEAVKLVKIKKIHINLFTTDNTLEIEIHDNGPGISNKVVQEIFKNNYTTKKNGNGIGLYISKILVEQLNGTLTYQKSNKIEYSSNFTIKIGI